MRYRKKNNISILLVLLLMISVGYAALSTQLDINGTAKINNHSWMVYWNNIVVSTGSVEATAPQLGQDSGQQSNTKVTWSVTLNQPGDYYEFTVDAVNNGTLDAMIDEINDTVSPTLPSYVDYTVTYEDGTEIEENHLLPQKNGNTPTVETYKVRVEFSRSITTEELNAIPSGGVTYTFTFEVVYVQATDEAIESHPVPTIDSCPGCVFAVYSGEKRHTDYDVAGHLETRDFLTDYTNNYRTLTENGNQRKVFLGHVLDQDGRISRGFVCGIKDYGTPTENTFCFESLFAGNGGLSSEQFTSKMAEYKNFLQSSNMYNNTCVQDDIYFDCYGSMNVDIDFVGTISFIVPNDYYCYLFYDGVMNCGHY